MYDLLNIKDYQGPFASNSKTFKALYSFPGLYRTWKTGKKFFKDFQGSAATL